MTVHFPANILFETEADFGTGPVVVPATALTTRWNLPSAAMDGLRLPIVVELVDDSTQFIEVSALYTHAGTTLSWSAGDVSDGSNGAGALVTFSPGAKRIGGVVRAADLNQFPMVAAAGTFNPAAILLEAAYLDYTQPGEITLTVLGSDYPGSASALVFITGNGADIICDNSTVFWATGNTAESWVGKRPVAICWHPALEVSFAFVPGDGGGTSFGAATDFGAGRTGEDPRSLTDRLQDVVNVKDFGGAAGDGTTDDTAALQAAFNLGGEVYLPDGVYRTTALLEYPSNITIRGHNATILKDFAGITLANQDQDESTLGADIAALTFPLAVQNENVTIDGITFDNQGVGDDGHHLFAVFVKNLIVRNCRIKNTQGQWAFKVTACTDVLITGITGTSGDSAFEDGIHIDGGENIVISDFNLSSGDDTIALSSGRNIPFRNITVGPGVARSNIASPVKILLNTTATGTIERIRVIGVIGRVGASSSAYLCTIADLRTATADIGISDVQVNIAFHPEGSTSRGVLIDRVRDLKLTATLPTSGEQGIWVEDSEDIDLVDCLLDGAGSTIARTVIQLVNSKRVTVRGGRSRQTNALHNISVHLCENVLVQDHDMIDIQNGFFALRVSGASSKVRIQGGKCTPAAGATITAPFSMITGTTDVIIDGVDLSALTAMTAFIADTQPTPLSISRCITTVVQPADVGSIANRAAKTVASLTSIDGDTDISSPNRFVWVFGLANQNYNLVLPSTAPVGWGRLIANDTDFTMTVRSTDDTSSIRNVLPRTAVLFYRHNTGVANFDHAVFGFATGAYLPLAGGTIAGSIVLSGSVRPGQYSVAGVPSASTAGAGAEIHVTNGAAGSPVQAFSDGTNWLRCDTLAAISAT